MDMACLVPTRTLLSLARLEHVFLTSVLFDLWKCEHGRLGHINVYLSYLVIMKLASVRIGVTVLLDLKVLVNAAVFAGVHASLVILRHHNHL